MKKEKLKNLTLRNKKGESERIINAFKLAFEKGSNLNVRVKDGFIYFVGGILNKLDKDGHSIAVKGKWIKV